MRLLRKRRTVPDTNADSEMRSARRTRDKNRWRTKTRYDTQMENTCASRQDKGNETVGWTRARDKTGREMRGWDTKTKEGSIHEKTR